MNRFSAVGTVLAILIALSAVGEAKYVSSVVKASSGKPRFRYLTKFAYNNNGKGVIKFEFKPGTSGGTGQRFIGISDDHWHKVYPPKKHWTCSDVTSLAEINVPVPSTNVTKLTFGKFQRPRFWYFAALNCEETGLDFSYQLTLLNGGGAWTKQFSVDAQGLLPTYLVFSLAFIAGMVIHMYGVITKWRQEGMHPIVKLLTITIIMITISAFAEFVHLAVYAGNGVGAPVMDGVSQVMDMGAQLVFMLLLILIAKGWTISTAKLTDRRLMFIILSLFLFVYVALFIWQEAGQDPATTDYVYESVPGIILLVLRMLTLVWFLYCLVNTFRAEIHPEKRKFYLTFGALYFLWFVALPIIVCVASVLDPWIRKKTVTAIYLLFNMFALSGLGWLLWPTRAHVYFKISGPDVLTAGATPYDQI